MISSTIKKIGRSLSKTLGKTLKQINSDKYTDDSELKDLTPYQIISMDPKRVSSRINITDNLSNGQQKALRRLLSIKEIEKDVKHPTVGRQHAIVRFFEESDNDKLLSAKERKELFGSSKSQSTLRDVNKLIVEATVEHEKSNAKSKVLENRLRTLRDKPTRPLTFVEEFSIRLDDIRKPNSKSPHTQNKSKSHRGGKHNKYKHKTAKKGGKKYTKRTYKL